MLKSEVANTSNTLKSVIRNLKPIEVMSGSPTQAIISLAQHNCSLAGITLKIFSKDEVTLSQEGAYQVYRIGQEALNNAIKHSSAQEITLSFRVTGNIYRVQITDDGKGMEEETAEDSYGMNSMNERSMILGASLSVDSQGSNGTTILLEVPIHD
ncbi:Signal transduction histidine-protein kinase/phosphatase DegS [Marinomonas spartinae]|uniref:histidine kinase n=2 Tax=Marinomonas spartinae TaxID=1792290 RepID=A0A1A8TUU0_9GAMM|nr:Signal transduction histidine-protein kinase/phosphatase DegS [Marinomonas spartinae]